MAGIEFAQSREQNLAKELASRAGNVALRFEVYKYVEPQFDIYEEIYKRLPLMGNERIVDVGTHDGSFIFWLKNKGHKGDLLGVEPEHAALPDFHNQRQIRFFENYAQSLFGADGSVDVLTANFMMYFVPPQEHDAVLNEFKRVLKSSGRLVVSTSGAFNKARHRVFEERIANFLGVSPPQKMNSSFNSEYATLKLSQNFKNILHASYKGKMVFKDLAEFQAYYNSLLSMKEFFRPSISEDALKEAYLNVVFPVAQAEIAAQGRFEDFVERDFYICSDDIYGLPVFDPASRRPKLMKGYVLEQINEE